MTITHYTVQSPTEVSLTGLTTEKRNEATQKIDQVSTLEMVHMINTEDKKVAIAIEKVLPTIAKAIDTIAIRLKRGGRLFYIGAGTSGRLGILDAVECPPTYGVSPELIQGIIAGGNEAIFKAVEGAEDSPLLALNDLRNKQLTANDIVVGIAASGRTPYVIGALEFARHVNAATIAITCNENSQLSEIAKITITPIVGPEAITGSTRLKAGTAQKLVLNMLSTGAMIKLGKVYGNLMVDVQTTNLKLQERACRILMEVTDLDHAASKQLLEECNWQVKTAILAKLANLSPAEASLQLNKQDGYIAKALESLN